MANFVYDDFTDTDGTLLTAHTVSGPGAIGGAWVGRANVGGGSPYTADIRSNRARGMGVGAAQYSTLHNAGTPSGATAADYTVVARFRDMNGVVLNSGTYVGVNGRMAAASFTMYHAVIGEGNKVNLYHATGSTQNKLYGTSVGFAASAGESYDLYLEMVGSAQKIRLQRQSDGYWFTTAGEWQAAQTDTIVWTNNSITAAGFPGVWLANDSGVATGWHMDAFAAYGDGTGGLTVADTTPPTLSAATSTGITSSTATVGVTTNEPNGTMYAIVSTSSTPPSVAQIQAGQTNTGTAATWSGNQAITIVGAKTFNSTGLTPSTTYYAHFQHRDTSGNNSTVLTGSGFATAAVDTTAPNLSSPTATATGSNTATGSVTTDEGNGTLYRYVSLNPTESAATVKGSGATSTVTASGAQSGLTFTGLTAATTYYAHYLHRDAAGNDSSVVNSSSFTTNVGPTVVPVTNTNVFFSPYNWYSDGGGAMQANNVKVGSTYAWCNMRGGYLKFKATVNASGTISLNLNTTSLSGLNAAGCPRLAWSVGNGAIQQYVLVAGDTSLSLATALSAGTYDVFVWFMGVYITQDGDSAQNYTTPNNKVHISSIQLSSGGSVSAPALKSKRMLAFGDSITEGDLSMGGPRSATSQDAHSTYGWYLSEALDAEIGIVAFYGKAWSWFNSTWGNYANGLSRLVGGLLTPAPDFITINYGENDGDPGPAPAVVNPILAAIAVAAPTARIVLIVPFSGRARTNLTLATLPATAVRVDLNRPEIAFGKLFWTYDGQHPDRRGHANLGPLLAYAVRMASPATIARTVSIVLTSDGTTPRANLSGLKWAWFDVPQPQSWSSAKAQGSGATTDVNGLFSVTVQSNLSVGEVGWLVVTDSDGTTVQSPSSKTFSGPIQVA